MASVGRTGWFLARLVVPAAPPGWYVITASSVSVGRRALATTQFHVTLPARVQVRYHAQGRRGQIFVTGSDFDAGSVASLYLVHIGTPGHLLGLVRVDHAGGFDVRLTVPRLAPGQYAVRAVNAARPDLGSTSAYFDVLF